MSKHAWLALAALCFVLSAPNPAHASTPDNTVAVSTAQPMNPPAKDMADPPHYPTGKFSGVVYADYYGNLVGDPTHAYSSSGAPASSGSFQTTRRSDTAHVKFSP